MCELTDENTFIRKSVAEWKEDRNVFIATGFLIGVLSGAMLVTAYLSLPKTWF